MENWREFVRFEWLLIEFIVLGLLIREWFKIRRILREDRAKRARGEIE